MSKETGNILYLECYSGISGDMTVGALLDLGADRELLENQLHTLPVKGFRTEIGRVKKSGLDACDFRVILDEEHENHDHDMEYLYGHEHIPEEDTHHGACAQTHGTESHTHHHGIESHHHETESHSHLHGTGAHSHGTDAHVHEHEHRGLPEIRSIILNSGLTERAKKIALDIFTVLAQAEAKAHGTSMEEVHFHEVGAVDSIVDIVAAAVCLDNLDIREVIVPELYEGRGTVRCQHGVIPVPVPAVVNIVGEHGISLHMTNTEAELVTPTGAAIVAAVRTSDRLPARYHIRRIGTGAGKRDYGRASILRGMLIEPDSQEQDSVYMLESDIDDCTGEALGYAMECLLEAGARDVHYSPVFMKKNRPAYELRVLCGEELLPKMEEIIFRETTTIGIRRMKVERTVLKRRTDRIATSLGEADVKVCGTGGNIEVYPEYESVAAICQEKGMAYREVWEEIRREAVDKIVKR